MAEMLVDSTKLDACLDAEADAIRAKTGDSNDLTFDFTNNKGFADAIAAIPSGGSTEVTITDGGNVSQAISTDTIYHFTGNITSLTITLNDGGNGNYQFDFTAGASAPSLSIPSTIDVPSDFTVRAFYKHTVVIRNGVLQFFLEAVLPSGYSAVPCVHIPLDGYVNTGKLLTKLDSEFYVTARIDSDLSSGTRAIFGALSGNSYGFLASYTSQNGFVYQYLKTTDFIVSQTRDNAKHNYYCGAGGIQLIVDSSDNKFLPHWSSSNSAPNYPVFIAARNDAGSPVAKTELTLWRYTHSVSGEWVINLVPCRQESNQEYGFFDTISGSFFGNSGSGTFTEVVE